MNRLAAIALMLVCLSSSAIGQDAVQEELDRAKKAYETEKDAYRNSIIEAYNKREESARKSGDKKAVDQAKAERDAFENWGVIPVYIPSAVSKKRVPSRARMEAAFNAAIKASIKNKNDDAAAAIEKELHAFRCEDWPHLNLELVKFKGDFFQIPSNSSVSSTTKFSGPIEIHLVARTEKENIRICANRGARVIFNWEANMSELRVSRPDGNEQFGTGSLAVAKVTPLKPGTWYKFRWRLTDEGMQVFVNEQMVFSEKRAYDLTLQSPISLETYTSAVEVKDFYAVPVTKE